MTYGLVAVAGGQLAYFNAIESIPIGIAVLLEYLALLLDLAGSSRMSPIGIMWGLLEAVSLAVYFLLSAGGGDEVLPPLVMARGGMCVGAAVLVIAAATGVLHATAHAGDVELLHRHLSWIVPVLALSLISAVIAYVAGIAAARRLGARLASFTGMAEVLFAVPYAWLLLGQLPSPVQFIGGAFMLAGVILVRADEKAVAPEFAESAAETE
jgi:drug/metabolite transporter (DMT)-like permease